MACTAGEDEIKEETQEEIRHPKYSLKNKVFDQIEHLRDLVGSDDVTCYNNLRMNRETFNRFCVLMENVGGLRSTRNVSVMEQVAMFLSVLSHHKKNVDMQTDFKRSGYTISKYFNTVLTCLFKLHPVLVVTPEPIPDDCTDEPWKYFKGCLGALDGSHFEVRVGAVDRVRYLNRKRYTSINMLAVCDKNMNFVYMLSGWEGSASDIRILKDAVTRRNRFKVRKGHYYLVDKSYTNGNGFLAPYRSVRYHPDDFSRGPSGPQNYQEYFNMKHAEARNVIERAVSTMKSRWAILKSPANYPIEVQSRIIMACCLLDNFIRTSKDHDPEEANVPKLQPNQGIPDNDDDFINNVESSVEWTTWRDTLAMKMYNDYLATHPSNEHVQPVDV